MSQITAPNDGIGVDQTWQNVTGSRTFNTTYTNTTGRPIQIALSFYETSTSVTFTIDGIAFVMVSNSSYRQAGIFNFIIPNGSTYSVSTINSTVTWAELR